MIAAVWLICYVAACTALSCVLGCMVAFFFGGLELSGTWPKLLIASSIPVGAIAGAVLGARHLRLERMRPVSRGCVVAVVVGVCLVAGAWVFLIVWNSK